MTRRIRRTERFEISLLVTDPAFIQPPRDSQRNWLLNRAVKEFADDLIALDQAANRFVPGADPNAQGVSGLSDLSTRDMAHGDLSDDEIMEDWQIPLMKRMAGIASASGGDVLEIGFGRGVSSGFIQAEGVSSHTIVECNESVIERFRGWKQEYPSADISLIEGRWQDVTDKFEQYDAVFFHTYPLSQDEYVKYVNDSATFAEHFFATASECLRAGGVFTYLTNEIDSLSRTHQRLLFRHFSEFSASLQKLALPIDVADKWWADSMVIVRATR
jgi:guanidinoacetate N-methyltransferase